MSMLLCGVGGRSVPAPIATFDPAYNFSGVDWVSREGTYGFGNSNWSGAEPIPATLNGHPALAFPDFNYGGTAQYGLSDLAMFINAEWTLMMVVGLVGSVSYYPTLGLQDASYSYTGRLNCVAASPTSFDIECLDGNGIGLYDSLPFDAYPCVLCQIGNNSGIYFYSLDIHGPHTANNIDASYKTAIFSDLIGGDWAKLGDIVIWDKALTDSQRESEMQRLYSKYL